MAGYSGAWRRRSTPILGVPALHQPIAVEHSQPEPDADKPWQSTVAQPDLPPGWDGGDGLDMLAMASGFGPVYDPDPGEVMYGVGRQPGVPLDDGRATAAAAQATDDGSVAAHTFGHAFDRDGQPRLDVVVGAGTDVDSPETVAIQHRTGVGSPYDPHAVRTQRQQRWYDRYIDMHRFDEEYGPKRNRSARTAQPQPAPATAGPLDSPWPTAVTDTGDAPQDRYVSAQARIEPSLYPAMPTVPGPDGLTSWGL